MAGWHHWLDGCKFEWTLGVGDEQGGLACCDSWGHKESNTTEWLNWTESNTVKGFGIVSKAEVFIFLELSRFFDDLTDIGNSISGSSVFSKSSLNIWKFTIHILLKPGLKNFEHYFTSVWDKCNSVVVWAFSDIAFEIGMKTYLFQSCKPLLSFPNLLTYWVQHFHSIIF